MSQSATVRIVKQITLRLDDETFAALATEAEKEDRSINWVIRHRLESPGSSWVAPTPDFEADDLDRALGPIPTTHASLGNNMRTAGNPVEKCPHPITRRIGNACGQCGKEVK